MINYKIEEFDDDLPTLHYRVGPPVSNGISYTDTPDFVRIYINIDTSCMSLRLLRM